jgi:hypothetical protein
VYLADERCAERIYTDLGPETKLIFMLRNPIDRAYSHYCMLRSHQFEDIPFEQAIELSESDRLAKSLKYYEHEHGFQYLKESSYSQSVQRFLRYFDQDKVKYVLFEEFAADTKRSLVEILGFLGADQGFEFELDVYKNQKTVSSSSKLNEVFYVNPVIKKVRDQIQMKTGWKTQSLLKKLKNSLLTEKNSQIPSMSERTRERLNDYFKDETARLEVLLGRDLSVWK